LPTLSNRLEAHLTPKVILSACTIFTLAYAVFSIHGFSLSYWHFLDRSPESEVLLGKAQAVRSDDWTLWLPFAFAQIKHDPPFALVNENIALGQNMSLIVSAPVADPIVLFRPHAWGYFVGPDFGMGWCWGFYVFGFIAAFHLLFMEISGGRSALSLFAAVALLFSPFFQFWALNSAFLASSVAFGVVAAHRLAFATHRHEKWLYGIGLGWSAGAFVLTLYPPFQVVMGYFGLFTLLGLILRSLKRGRSIRWDGDRSLASLAALLILGFAVLHLFQIASDAIALSQNTLYPGQRFASGGTSALWRIFSNNVYPHFFVRASPAFRGNLCEGASFILFFPLILFVLVQKNNRSSFAADPLLLSLLAFIAILLAWNLLGFPEAVAQFTLLSKAPEHRTVIGFGVADMALVVALLGSSEVNAVEFRSKARRGGFFMAIVCLLLVLLILIGSQDPQFFGPGALLQVALLVIAQLSIAFLVARKQQTALVAFAALNVLSTAWFNPVVHGGFDYLWNNPVSAKIRDLDAARGGRSSWIVFDAFTLGQLPPMLGARSLTSVQFYPQMQFWSVLDPEHRQTPAYNRFAHVALQTRDDPGRISMSSPGPDVCIVSIHPDDPRLLALPFDYVIQSGDPRDALSRSPHYRRIADVGDFHFYERIGN